MFRKKIEEKPNIAVCSLLDANAEVRTFFDVEADWDEQFPILYFSMYDIEDKKKKRMSDIVVNYNTRREDLNKLCGFLTNWNFKNETAFWFECDCQTDGLRFRKIKKEVSNDKEDNIYIDYFYSGTGKLRKHQAIEVNITKDQAMVLARQIERFLNKKNKVVDDVRKMEDIDG